MIDAAFPRQFLFATIALAAILPAAFSQATEGVPAGESADARRPKKLIATGWDHPDTARLRANLAEMERWPFDGVVLQAVGQDEAGKARRLRWAFQAEPWQREWFRPCVEDLKACRFQRFTDNFVTLNANPGNVDWFDDAGWQQVVDHWRIAAWLARESGLKGILFDPEPYSRPYAQFHYAAQPQRDEHTFDEYYAKARQRGREVMQAVVEEYSDLTLFCYFMNSVTATATGRADPRRALATLGYGLYPAFIDGWLDVLPPTVRLVDGCESAYRYNSRQQFLEAALKIKGCCQELVSPKNRAKYRAAAQVSFGLYLDAYWNPKDSEWGRWYIDGLGGPRVERLRVNAQTALEMADEYVWIYGEKFRWWPTPNGRVWEKTWPEGLPGSDAALAYARDPVAFARQRIQAIRASGGEGDLARNGHFGAGSLEVEGRSVDYREGGPPAGWSAWQAADSEGKFTWDRETGTTGRGSARAAGVANGCFLQHHGVEPGQRYAVRVVCRRDGKGDTWIRVRWQTAEGAWTAQGQDRLFIHAGEPHVWNEILGVVEIPEGVGKLVILLGVGGQPTEKDVAWFDDVELYRID